MFLSLLLSVGALIFLVLAADRAVGEAESVADKVGLSPVVVGALIIGLGTSLPEMVVSGIAAFQRETIDLAIGNFVGSNAANLTLVLGTGSVITTIRPNRSVFRTEGLLMLLATVLVTVILWDSRLALWESVILLVAMVAGAAVIAKGNSQPSFEPTRTKEGVAKSVLTAVAALTVVVVSAQVLVISVVDIAEEIGVSEAFIGLTIVAIGTSLPELATTVAAARQGSVDLIVGNIFGSNIFNSLAVVGIAGVVGTGRIDSDPTTSLAVMLAVTAVALIAGALRSEYSKTDGLVLLAVYPIILLLGHSG